MKNSISELAENFNSKSALNFISNQTCKRAKDTAPGGVINFAPASRFKRNFKFKDATAELNFISVRNLKFYPTSAGFAARNRASVGFAVHSLVAPYSAPRVRNIEKKVALNFCGSCAKFEVRANSKLRRKQSFKFRKSLRNKSLRKFRKKFQTKFYGKFHS